MSLQPAEGLNNVVACASIPGIVCMRWHSAADLYTLGSADQLAMDSWLDSTRSSGRQAAAPPPRTSRAARRALKAQRKPGLTRGS